MSDSGFHRKTRSNRTDFTQVVSTFRQQAQQHNLMAYQKNTAENPQTEVRSEIHYKVTSALYPDRLTFTAMKAQQDLIDELQKHIDRQRIEICRLQSRLDELEATLNSEKD